MSDQLQPDLNYIKLWMQYHIDILRKGHPSEVTIDFLQEWMAFCQSQNVAILELEAKVAELEKLLAAISHKPADTPDTAPQPPEV